MSLGSYAIKEKLIRFYKISSLINSIELVERMVDAKIFPKNCAKQKFTEAICNVSQLNSYFFTEVVSVVSDAVFFFLASFVYMSALSAFTPNILFWPYF